MKSVHEEFCFDRAGLREIDRRAMEEYGIPIVVLMENAGRAVAQAVRGRLKRGAGVGVVCGTGNNGGDGLVAARHLHNAGVKVHVFLMAEAGKFGAERAGQLAIIEKMGLEVEVISPGHAELRDWIVEGTGEDVIVDAIFGTGLSRRVEGLAAEVIRAINASRRAVVSVDIPSGLDCDSGLPLGEAVRAAETVSMCGMKAGFVAGAAYVGKVSVGEIGVPVELLRAVGKFKIMKDEG